MPVKSPHALSWNEFENLIEQAYQLAKEQGRGHLYRFIIYAGVAAYHGLSVNKILRLRWLSVGPDWQWLPGTVSIVVNTHELNARLELSLGFLRVVHQTFSLAFPAYANETVEGSHFLLPQRVVEKSDPILQQYIVPQQRSNGSRPISHKSLNKLLVDVAVELGYAPDRLSAIVFRKTWARRQFDLMGQTSVALSNIKRKLKSKSLAEAMRFIALPHENGVPLIRP